MKNNPWKSGMKFLLLAVSIISLLSFIAMLF